MSQRAKGSRGTRGRFANTQRLRQEKPSKVEVRGALRGQGKGSPPRLMQEEISKIEAISDEEEKMFSASDDWDRSNSEAESSGSSDGGQSSDSNESNSKVEDEEIPLGQVPRLYLL